MKGSGLITIMELRKCRSNVEASALHMRSRGGKTFLPQRELQEQMRSVRGMTTAYSFHEANLLVNPDKRSNASLISSAA